MIEIDYNTRTIRGQCKAGDFRKEMEEFIEQLKVKEQK